MNPAYLINRPWWKEPPKVEVENNCRYYKQFIDLYLDSLCLPLEERKGDVIHINLEHLLETYTAHYLHEQQQRMEVEIVPLD